MKFDKAKIAEQIEEAKREVARGDFDRVVITHTRLHDRARKGHYGFRNDSSRALVAGDEVRNQDGSVTTIVDAF